MDMKEEFKPRFSVKYDTFTGSFKILDTWHEAVRNLAFTDDIPDTSPAVKIITGEEFNALIGEAKRQGFMERMSPPAEEARATPVEKLPRILQDTPQETAIKSIRDIVIATGDGADADTAGDAISAIREVINSGH